MASKLFDSVDRPIAQRIAEIAYCNVFEERRWQLEQECLGSEYREPEKYVQPEEGEERLAPNVSRLVEITVGILEKARARLVRGGASYSKEELDTYASMVHFLVYHRLINRFDELISRSLQGSASNENVHFYGEYRDQQRYYLSVSSQTQLEPSSEAMLFAFYFQVRRAWLNIHRSIVGASPSIVELRSRIWQSSFTHDMRRYQRALFDKMEDIVTLITGPSGSGKELVARAVGLSRYVPFDYKTESFLVDFAEAFYPLNLSALSPTLIESELFGHRKGAFTGALQDRKGYFEECGAYGTVFLDEVGETDPSIQVKLLRVLQTRQFQRLGDTRSQPFTGKVMAATNRDLSSEIADQTFREDFYFRLCADRIETPRLKDLLCDSDEELDCMVAFIANRVVGREEGRSLKLEACSWIRGHLGPGYDWPGNFRELEQCVRNIMIRGRYDPEFISEVSKRSERIAHARKNQMTANQLLSRYAQEVYRDCGSYEETAKQLKVDRRTAKRYVLGVE